MLSSVVTSSPRVRSSVCSDTATVKELLAAAIVPPALSSVSPTVLTAALFAVTDMESAAVPVNDLPVPNWIVSAAFSSRPEAVSSTTSSVVMWSRLTLAVMSPADSIEIPSMPTIERSLVFSEVDSVATIPRCLATTWARSPTKALKSPPTSMSKS